MECTQVLLSESFDDINTVTEKCPVATLAIGDEYYTIYNTQNVIGRENACDVVISNSAVSSKHAIIEAEDANAHLIYDLGSTNKTKLGKMVLKPHVRYHINDGDHVTFGNVSAQYNISRQYPTTPVKAKPSNNTYCVPETPVRPEPTQELTVVGDGIKKLKVDNSPLNTSDTDIFDENDGIKDNKGNPIRPPEAVNDIYELDTLSFDESETLVESKQNACKSDTISTKSSVVEETPMSDLSVYDVSTQEPISDERHLPKGLSIFDKDKVINSEWEDFPEIASPVGLDTSNADNLDCPKPKLSSTLIDVTTDDLKKNEDISKNIGDELSTDFCKTNMAESTIRGTNKNLEENPAKSKNENNPDLTPEEDPENDIFIPLSQNVDMFCETPKKSKSECSEEMDVYEILTQVNDPDDSIYDIQTQLAVICNQSTPKPTSFKRNFISPQNESLSTLLEPATQTFVPKTNDEVTSTSTSFNSVKVIDETDQNCTFSTSMYEAATQQYPQVSEGKSLAKKEIENKSNKDVDKISVKSRGISDGNSSLSTSLNEVVTQPIIKRNQETREQDVNVDSLENMVSISNKNQTKTIINESFSLSMYEAGTQPCSKASPDTTLVKVKDKIDVNNSFSSSMYEAATQPCQKATVKKTLFVQETSDEGIEKADNSLVLINDGERKSDSYSNSKRKVTTRPCPENSVEKEVDECANVDTSILSSPGEFEEKDSFSSSMYEAATQPCPREKIESFKEVTSVDETKNTSNFSASMCEIATQPYPQDLAEKIQFMEQEIHDETKDSDASLVACQEESDNTSFSASMFEAATQPYPQEKSELPKEVTSLGETKNACKFSTSTCKTEQNSTQGHVQKKQFIKQEIHRESADTCNTSVLCQNKSDENSFSTSISEAATQRFEEKSESISEKSTSMDKITSTPQEESIMIPEYVKGDISEELKTASDETRENISFSTSMYEAATQPCPYDSESRMEQNESVERNENFKQLIKETDVDVMKQEIKLVHSDEDQVKCDSQSNEEEKLLLTSESVYDADARLLCHSEVPAHPIQDKIITTDSPSFNSDPKNRELSNSIINIKNDIKQNPNTTFSESFIEIATQPAPVHTDSVLIGKGECLPEELETTNAEENVSILITTASTQPISKGSFTAPLPNSLSNTFFEAATQPYKDVNMEDKVFLDPLTSICNDLSVDKISEITDELMYGNISRKLADTGNVLDKNNGNEESGTEILQNVEMSDDNIIYEVLNQTPFCSSVSKGQSSKINDEHIAGKLSTQDLKRILESDDLTQKYEEFQQISTNYNQISTKEQNLSKKNVLLSNDKIQIFGDKESLKHEKLFSDQDEVDVKSGGVKLITCNKTSSAQGAVDAIEKYVKDVSTDESQDFVIMSNKKRCNTFPPDSQTYDSKNTENDDSSQELNIRFKRKHNIFSSESQNFDSLEGEDTDSQELMIRSNKKRCNVFPPDTQELISNQNFENESKISKEPNIKESELRTNGNEGSSETKDMSSDFKQQKKIENNENLSNVTSFVANAEILPMESKNLPGTKDEDNTHLNNSDKSNVSPKLSSKIGKGKSGEKRTSKEPKHKSPPEREPSYISRGNITLHSPEVLSELEEQFRLTKVAMSPTQLSVASDIDNDFNSSQEVSDTPKQDIRRSGRNKKSSFKRGAKNNQLPSSQKKLEPAHTNEILLEQSENKRTVPTNSALDVSKSQKTFKKFKKVSPTKINSSSIENEEKIPYNETSDSVLSINENSIDNSQNSEELGRGKRKRVRTSYEGFILEDDNKKRTPRKKLSFSQIEDNDKLNSSQMETNIEEASSKDMTESHDHQSNDSISSIKHTVSVVLHDIQKIPDVIANKHIVSNIGKNKEAKNKTVDLLLDDEENSLIPAKKKLNLPSTSGKDKSSFKSRNSETSNKEKDFSFSFTDKLDELFDIWGPADRVKLSPRVAKKSYKLLANGKVESGNITASTRNTKKNDINISSKDTKQSRNSSNKDNNKPSIENKLEKAQTIDIETNSRVNSRRKRTLLQKSVDISPDESSSGTIELNKKRKKQNSETSENSIDFNDGDNAIRKSSRISKKKTDEVTSKDSVSESKSQQIVIRSTRFSRGQVTQDKKLDVQSVESTSGVVPVNNRNKVEESKNKDSTDAFLKPPLLNTVVNLKSKNPKPNNQITKNLIHAEPSSSYMLEEGFCFSQEYSFHDSKVEKEKNLLSARLPSPLKIRRSGRKRNQKTTEKGMEHVMFTGIPADKKMTSLVTDLGGQIVGSPFTCTVLVTDKIRRTTKFLSALSRGLPIVSPQWLIDSKENGKFMDVDDFLLTDKEAEKLFSFNLKKSIEKAQATKVLNGWSVFVTPSVKPSPEEMKSIIECSGGRFLSKEPARWPTNSLVISCNEDRPMWSKLTKRGKGPILVDNEAILLGVLRQELDLEKHRLL